MKKIVHLFLALIISSTILAQNPNPSAAMDKKITDIMNTKHLPGVSTLLVKGGEIVWIKSYGYANTALTTAFTDTTSLMLASISKAFTGIAIMQLYERGLFGLDDNINKYLPFDVKIPNFKNDSITFRMLLTHTSSINDGDAMDNYYNDNGDPTISLGDCMERYFSTKGVDYKPTENFFNKKPGTSYFYSNMAVGLEGYLVERISGTQFNIYCNQNIFNPLCMKNTHWFLSEYQNLSMLANPHKYSNLKYQPITHYGFADYPDGMLHTNVTDLGNFMITILQDGTFHNNTILSAANLNTMFTPQVPSIEPKQGLQFYKEKFNVSSGSILLWGHSGEELGINTEMYFDRSNDMGIAVLANGDSHATQIVEQLYDYGLTLSPSGVGNPACDFTTNINTPTNLFSYDVYPNPSSYSTSFRTTNTTITAHEIRISDVTGRSLLSIVNKALETTIDVSTLSNGIYIYTINENNKTIKTGKLIISK